MKIKTETDKIGEIFGNICRYGKLVKEAKTKWGADVWELDGVQVALEDEGATWSIQSVDLIVRSTMQWQPVYSRGSSKQLDELYISLFGIDEECEHDHQPDDYTEWRDYTGGDYGVRRFRYWELLDDHDQYDNDY